jgi:hypothetical protein
MRRIGSFFFLALAATWVACHDRDRGEAPYVERQRYCTDVECIDDTTCTSTLAPHCLEGFCTECASDRHCTPPLGLCRGGACACSEDEACVAAGEGAACVQGACVECGDDEDCVVSNASICYEAGTRFAFCGCARNEDCGGAVCDQGVCSICGTDADCSDPTPKCFAADTQLSFCGCADASDCADGETCILGVCGVVACNVDGDCAGTPDSPQCYSGGTFDAYCGCTTPAKPGEDEPPLRVLPPLTTCKGDDGEGGTFDGLCDDGRVTGAPGTCNPITCKSDSDCAEMEGTPKCIFPGAILSFCGCGSSADCAGPSSNPQECRDGECLCSTAAQCNSSTVAITVCI